MGEWGDFMHVRILQHIELNHLDRFFWIGRLDQIVVRRSPARVGFPSMFFLGRRVKVATTDFHIHHQHKCLFLLHISFINRNFAPKLPALELVFSDSHPISQGGHNEKQRRWCKCGDQTMKLHGKSRRWFFFGIPNFFRPHFLGGDF